MNQIKLVLLALLAASIAGCAVAAAPVVRSARAPIVTCGEVAGAPWICIESVTDRPKWEVVSVTYIPPERAGGDRNIYVTLLSETGLPVNGETVYLDTGVAADRSYQITKAGGTCDFPMTGDSNFFPDLRERGPYSVFVGGMVGDWVTGMGLPVNQHVVVSITFRRVSAQPTIASSVTPVPNVTPLRTPTSGASPLYVTRQDLIGALRAAISYLEALP